MHGPGRARSDTLGMFEQDLRDAAANGPAADERDIQRFGHCHQ
jgi:hypothetical protein